MPSNKTDEVIVLDVKEIGEADLLISFLTRHSGRLKGIGKHAKKSIRRFPNCFSPGNLLSLDYSIRPNKELTFLIQGRLYDSPLQEMHHLRLTNNISLALYALKLTDIALPPSLPEPDVFETLLKLLKKLKEAKEIRQLCLYYETKLMKILGYEINLTECLSCKRHYTFTGNAFFLPLKGGIYCKRCTPSSGTFTLEPSHVKIIQTYQTVDILDLPSVDLDPISSERIAEAILSHMKQHLNPMPPFLWELRGKILERS